MTATHLDALLAAADLTDRADRLMLADAMGDAGRGVEAEILRTEDGPRQVTYVSVSGHIRSIRLRNVGLIQGRTADGLLVGMVSAGETIQDGGFLFTWMETLAQTIETIRPHGEYGGGDLTEGATAVFLRGYLPTTSRGQRFTS